ncbi:hypothetical protein GCM10009809_13900 [Isoptericola hypogeus]|uniref:DUF3352 domain-containing protein n=1 Tax=Isoptericola hypogeus TaxID=300179 RepID=A0ABN2J704_9MICO
MSETSPATPDPTPRIAEGDPTGPTVSVDLTPGEPAPAPRRRARKLLTIGLAGGLVLVGGAGAVAYAMLSGGGAQPHDVLPANALAYARVDLDPSAGQKVEVLRLLQKFPALADSVGDEDADLRALFVEKALEDCDVDFAADVEPWLGQRVGVALLDEPFEPVVAIQVDDEDKARAGITELAECSGAEADGIAFLDGYAIVGSGQEAVDTAVAAAAEESLGETSAFTAATEKVGDQGVASGWADYGALMAHPELADLMAEGLEQSGQPPIELPELTGDLGTATVVIRAESSAIEVRGAFEGAEEMLGESSLDPAQLPDSTAIAYGTAMSDEFAEQYADTFLDAFVGAGGAQASAQVEAMLGVSIEELTTLLLSDPLLTVGERGLADLDTFTGPESVENLDVALRSHGDQAELRDIDERLAAAAETIGGVRLTVQDVDGGVALATSDSALEVGSGLAASEAFGSVVPFDSVSSLSYLDFDKLGPVIELIAEGDETVLSNLEPLRAFGVSSSGDEFAMRLSFDG